MKKLLLILLCLPLMALGQNVNILDANFKTYLVGNSLINTNGDTAIQLTEAASFNGSINCYNMTISDLTGIEDFTALDTLSCWGNQLTTLDVSNNTALTTLYCGSNQLTSLDVSQNTALTSLGCNSNSLTSLDVSNNTALIVLACLNNPLGTLDVSQNTALDYLSCGVNQLTTLDVSNNTALTILSCFGNNISSLDLSYNTLLTRIHCAFNNLTILNLKNGNNLNFIGVITPPGPGIAHLGFNIENNPNLSCVIVDDSTYSANNWSASTGYYFDNQTYFSNNCSSTGIEEHTTNKELLKVTDLLGRETKQTNQPLFYIYDDGTVEKRITIE